MKIYTRTGDKGETGLFGGQRVRKDYPRIEAYGTVDELNAALGVARAELAAIDSQIEGLLARIQNDLFDLGAELAVADPAKARRAITAQQVGELEEAIDRHDARLPPLKEFILPGGCPAAALLHLARTVCRRAERRVVALSAIAGEQVSADAIAYLNRLGDLLFVLARAANQIAGAADVPWKKGNPPPA
jgi:cob(I)alamin adenosyltransferase